MIGSLIGSNVEKGSGKDLNSGPLSINFMEGTANALVIISKIKEKHDFKEIDHGQIS